MQARQGMGCRLDARCRLCDVNSVGSEDSSEENAQLYTSVRTTSVTDSVIPLFIKWLRQAHRRAPPSPLYMVLTFARRNFYTYSHLNRPSLMRPRQQDTLAPFE